MAVWHYGEEGDLGLWICQLIDIISDILTFLMHSDLKKTKKKQEHASIYHFIVLFYLELS